MGGTTCVANHPKRIVTLYTPALASALALGVRPVAITPATGLLNPFPDYLRDSVQGLEIVATAGDVVNLERILELSPDLILGWKHHASIHHLLSQISPTVLPKISTERLHEEEWEEYLYFLAEVLDRKDMARKIVSHYNYRVEALKAALSRKYSDKKISVAHFSGEYGVEAYTRNSFAGSILADVGLQRSESQDVIAHPRGVIESISVEELSLIDGDVLFLLNFDEDGSKMIRSLQENPLWQKLKAVQQKKVYLVDGWTWAVGNPLAAYAVIDDLYRYLVESKHNLQ